MAKKYVYEIIPAPWPKNDPGMDTICARCKKRLGTHFELKCCDRKGVFSKRVRKPLDAAESANSQSLTSANQNGSATSVATAERPAR